MKTETKKLRKTEMKQNGNRKI